jgi:2-polyprenyl-3-methyl-5-hydroxy-6-metoxy-1,4-benzoquinol methylase
MGGGREEVELIECPFCACSQFKIIYSFPPLAVVRCEKCYLTYINPRLKESAIREIYLSPRYFKGGRGYQNYLAEKEIQEKKARVRIREIKKLIQGRILDVGCAYGFFLKIAQEEGFEGYGVEISPEAAQYAQKQEKINIIASTLEEVNLPSEFFEIITFWHTFEHLAQPKRILQICHRLLKKNGFLVMAVPNLNCLERTLSGQNWIQWKPEYHLLHFSSTTLKNFLRQNRFVPTKIKTTAEIGLGELFKDYFLLGKGKLNFLFGKFFEGVEKIKGPNRLILLFHWLINFLKKGDELVIFARVEK